MSRFGDYRLETLLARGGMAEIFRARRAGNEAGSTVCVKRIRPEFGDDREFEEMFLREARIASVLDHPNIVAVHEYDRHEGRLFLVMEFVDGVDLRHVLRAASERGLSLPVEFVFHVMRGLLAALDHAQNLVVDGEARPVVHRDVSPHNLLVSRTGEVKLTDFGIAKARGVTSATRTGVLKGKLAYLSPEQAAGGKVGATSDLFCAGIVMWEMLAGRRLMRGANEKEILARAIKAEVKPLPWLAPGIRGFLDRLLAKEPADRFPTAREASDALGTLEERFAVREGASIAARIVQGVISGDDASGNTGLMTPRGEPRDGEVAPMMAEGKTRTTLEDIPAPTNVGRGGRAVRGAILAAVLIAVFGAGAGGFVLGGSGGGEEVATEISTGETAIPAEASETSAPIVQRAVGTPDAGVRGGDAPGEAAEEDRAGRGFLDVNFRPWAKVRIDGRPAGTTPLKRVRLSEGKHRVTLTNAPAGYSKTFTVNVANGRTTRLNKQVD